MMPARPGAGPVVWHLGPRARPLAERLAACLGDATIAGPAPADLVAGFKSGRPIVAIAAAGIVVRHLAPHLADKRREPPVIVVDEGGRFVVPLLGGHRGANALAERLAAALAATAVVTTAGDARFGLALDAPPEGFRLAHPDDAKPVMAALLDGASCRLADPAALGDWLRASRLPLDTAAPLTIEITHERRDPAPDWLTFYPATLAIGVGCERHAPAGELAGLVAETLATAGLAQESVACVASVTLKAAEPAIHALGEALGVPVRFLERETLAAETPRLVTPSAVVEAEIGIPGVAEAAALAAAGAGGRLIVAKQKSRRCTVAVALAAAPIDPATIGRPQGRLTVLGFGPGDAPNRTAAVEAALRQADLVIGYGLYLDLVADLIGHAEARRFPLGEERDRCIAAIDAAALGRNVALVCSGDPGIYAMAALVMEILDKGGDKAGDKAGGEARARIAVTVLPGVSALQVAAARAGAPLGHDFAVVSLSDLLTPMAVIEVRLLAAARGDFALALYNPVSQRRRTALATARAILLDHRPPSTPVVIARNLGRPGEAVVTTTLGDLTVDQVDMLSIVLVGASQTRSFTRIDGGTVTYTPRGYPVGDRPAAPASGRADKPIIAPAEPE
jgi:cobalt-precorrin 5A hydrolase/precorrin-3B C17-methyltransferase